MPFFDIFASPRWSPLSMRTKVVSFFIFFQDLSNKKKIKALRPKMTKIASRGPALTFLPLGISLWNLAHLFIMFIIHDRAPPVPAKKKSALGFVKSEHRSMVSEGRLNALLRLYVHKDMHLDFEEVVPTYGHKHPRRMLLGRPLEAWFLHVEHLLLDLPDLPSDFKYFVKIVNICTNYLAYSLSDFSEIIPKIVKKMHICAS